MGGLTACMERIKVHTCFVAGKTRRKKSLILPRNRWKDNIKIDNKQKRISRGLG
jgi:hypothetical protein